MTLADLAPGDKGIITKVKGRGAFRKRILEMGFVSGKEVSVIQRAPLMDPVEYNVMSYNVSLRNAEARLIEILSETETIEQQEINTGSRIGSLFAGALKQKTKTINVAFVGNPNSGKTTLFNHASGLREHVGNYSGVTVDAKEARFKKGEYIFNVTDLPGTYSITAYTPEELFVRDFIIDSVPDVVVNIIDSSNLERNLYLTTQLIDMDIKMIGVLNMHDELLSSGNMLDHDKLGLLLGVPFVPTIGSKGKGVPDLLQKIIDVYEDRDTTYRHIHISYGNVIEPAINRIQDLLYKSCCNNGLTNRVSSRFLAIKLLEKDRATEVALEKTDNLKQILDATDEEIGRIETTYKQDTESVIADAKYGFIAGALKETFKLNPVLQRKNSEVIDTIVTHRIWGIPIFIFLMWLTFYATFKLGEYPMMGIEMLVQFVSIQLSALLPTGMLNDLFIQGIIGGVGGVIIFLPNILLLYLFISLMEDTGYMARAVFIMDKVMHKIGLHGKSFIPLVMGFGCNVPAILSTRIIESKRDRLITMLINPFMSCSARLPVYILFISAFFVNYQGTILFSMYGIGVALAIGSSLLFKKTIFRKADVPFVMELPPYRTPTIRTLLKHMWNRAEQYLRKMGGVILVASIIIWALGYFPRSTSDDYIYEKNIADIRSQYATMIMQTQQSGEVVDALKKKENDAVNQVEHELESHRQMNSYIGRLGELIEPAMRPLGFDWKMSVAVLTGVAAKEVTIGTLGVLYQADMNDDLNQTSLITKLQQQTYKDGPNAGQPVFTPLVAFSFMLFILIYFPCIAVVAAIKRESGAVKWAVFVVVYTTVLAYLASLITYQVGSLFF